MRMFAGGEGKGAKAKGRKRAVVSVLDLGSTKICCLVARLSAVPPGEALRGRTHAVEVLGIGHHRSRGIKSGVVVDLDAVEEAVRKTVDAAERMAGVTVESLIVTLSAGRLSSETCSASIALGGKPVSEGDVGRVLAAGRRYSVTEGRSVVHALPIGYSLDGNGGIADPEGMIGSRFGVDMHLVTADTPPIRNLELAINRCHLSVEGLVAAPYASGLSVLVDDEAELGCAVVDFGGGTTTIAVYSRGHLVHVDAVAIGGQHVTTDIARGLSTRIEDAERLKTMFGSALPGFSDEREMLSVPALDSDEHELPHQVPRSALTRIVKPRVDEILELVRDRLNASGFAALFGRRLVLTGGGSQLNGMAEAARRVLARNVRLGRPLGVTGLPENARGPAFAATVGLLVYPQVAGMELADDGGTHAHYAMTGTGDGYFSRVGNWIRESF
jgi:cell division protein FtsA